jgi:hypothetical protein
MFRGLPRLKTKFEAKNDCTNGLEAPQLPKHLRAATKLWFSDVCVSNTSWKRIMSCF